jgi:hypothetical protein
VNYIYIVRDDLSNNTGWTYVVPNILPLGVCSISVSKPQHNTHGFLFHLVSTLLSYPLRSPALAFLPTADSSFSLVLACLTVLPAADALFLPPPNVVFLPVVGASCSCPEQVIPPLKHHG